MDNLKVCNHWYRETNWDSFFEYEKTILMKQIIISLKQLRI